MTSPNQDRLRDAGLLLLRVMLGVVFVYHGSQKVFGAFGGGGIDGFAGYLTSLEVPMPEVSAWMAALAEFVGGLSLLTGVAMRLIAVPLAFTMFVAAFVGHAGKFSILDGGMEYALTLGVSVVALALTGPGRFVLGRPSPA